MPHPHPPPAPLIRPLSTCKLKVHLVISPAEHKPPSSLYWIDFLRRFEAWKPEWIQDVFWSALLCSLFWKVISPAGYSPPPFFLKHSHDPLSPHIRNSKIREIFACGIRNNAEESGIPPSIEIQTPSSIVKYWNPVPGIQNPRQSWIPLYGATLRRCISPGFIAEVYSM